MSYHTQARWLVGAAVACAALILYGCATTVRESKYVSKCKDEPKHAALLIKVDAAGDPTEVVDGDGKNADIIILCPNDEVTWTLMGATSPGSRWFEIEFTRAAPFDWGSSKKRKSTKAGNDHKLPAKIKKKGQVKYDGYKYIVDVDGSQIPLDPIIIVDR